MDVIIFIQNLINLIFQNAIELFELHVFFDLIIISKPKFLKTKLFRNDANMLIIIFN